MTEEYEYFYEDPDYIEVMPKCGAPIFKFMREYREQICSVLLVLYSSMFAMMPSYH